MEFNDVIKNRYSCRKFSDKKIEREKLQSILEAGRIAPTAKNYQEQHIYVIESDDILSKIDTATSCRYNAPTVLAICYNKDNTFTYPNTNKNSGVEDVSIVATHIMLSATNEGIDSCWLNWYDMDMMVKILNIPSNEELVLLMDLGYAKEDSLPSKKHNDRKELKEMVTYL